MRLCWQLQNYLWTVHRFGISPSLRVAAIVSLCYWDIIFERTYAWGRTKKSVQEDQTRQCGTTDAGVYYIVYIPISLCCRTARRWDYWSKIRDRPVINVLHHLLLPERKVCHSLRERSNSPTYTNSQASTDSDTRCSYFVRMPFDSILYHVFQRLSYCCAYNWIVFSSDFLL